LCAPSPDDVSGSCRSHGFGQRVDTEAIGKYPGGIATVTELAPDPQPAEIVFTVQHPTFGQMGVFDWELVTLVGTPAGQQGGTTPKTRRPDDR